MDPFSQISLVSCEKSINSGEDTIENH
jgi:hypothetical protein